MNADQQTFADHRNLSSIQALDSLQHADEEKFNAYLDAVISSYGGLYTKHLHMVAEDDERVKEFLDIVSIGMSGVLFYGGLVVQKLKGDGADLQGTFRIHIGGNGCKIFDWLFEGSDTFVEHSPHYQRAVNAFRCGSNSSPDQGIRLIKSSMPKAEVAFGLLDDAQNIDVLEETAVEFSGEIHKVNKAEVSWDVAIDPEAVAKRTLRIDRDLPVFMEFLGSIGVSIDKRSFDDLGVTMDLKINELKSDLPPKSEEAVVPTVRKVFGNRPGAASAGAPSPSAKPTGKLLRSEPLFIITLREYLKMRVREWVKGYGH